MDEKDKKIKDLEKEIKRLKKEKEKIQKEFEQYKAKYPAIKQKMELPAFVKENVKTEKKTPGQKKGHKPYFRKSPERIDYIKPLEDDLCPNCDGRLSGTQEIRRRIIIDIPLTSQTINTQYDIHRKYCKK